MVTLRDIETAYKRIRDSIYVSPFVESRHFSELTGNTVRISRGTIVEKEQP